MSDLHQEVGSPGGPGPEVSWKAAPRAGEGGEDRARGGEGQGGGGPQRKDLRGGVGAAAVLPVRAVRHRLQQQGGGSSIPPAPLHDSRGR